MDMEKNEYENGQGFIRVNPEKTSKWTRCVRPLTRCLLHELMPTRDAEAAGMPAIKEDADVRLLQVPVEPEFNSRTISYVEEGDEQVCYLLYDETRELLHLPPHIFELLARHCEDHHADRNMATHLVQFSRSQVRARDGAAHRPPWHQLLGCLGARVRFLSAVLGSELACAWPWRAQHGAHQGLGARV